jgi:streptogramin lyase
MPGTMEQKEHLFHCFACHHLDPVVRSRHDAGEFVHVLQRMKTYAQSTLEHPQMRGTPDPGAPPSKQVLETAEYLSTINLDATGTWRYPLKTLPRPKGKATRVIITEYDLPRPTSQPHDAVVDREGMVWYSDFGHQYLGKLDPRTGKVVEYPVPELRPGFITGANSVELDRDGNVWLGMMRQAGLAKFDRTEEEFQIWNIATVVELDRGGLMRIPMVMPRYAHLDGKVWTNNPGINGIHRLDIQSGKIESFDLYDYVPEDSPAAGRPHTVYGIAADSQNNLYMLDFYSEYIGRADAKTGEITLYQTPTFDSRPQRGHMDAQDRLWFAESNVNRIGMFDTRTEQFREWALPTPWTNPYDVVLDKNGDAWTGGMSNDLVARLNTKTGEFTEYLLPRFTNIRRVDVDDSTTPPTFWMGNNLGAAIIKLEPME